MDFMLTLGLNEAIDQLAIANSVHWYGHVLRRGWSCVEERGCSCVEERGWS